MNDTLTVNHNAGFFSCCSVRLHELIKFFNHHKKEPSNLVIKNQFSGYRINPADTNEDVNSLFFKPPDREAILFKREINYDHGYQFEPYVNLDFEGIIPFIKKYFTPSDVVLEFTDQIKQKYNINFETTVGVYYRGNDKCTETGIGTYEEYFNKCEEVVSKNPDATFLIQTDELEFRNLFSSKFKNSFFVEELPVINKNTSIAMHNLLGSYDRPKLGTRILGITYLLSKLKCLITHSGNCSEWAIFYRGNTNNVYQYLKHPSTAAAGNWV
jgi:hypothetical protein